MLAGEHSSSLTHVLYHVGMTALFVAAVYTVILLLFRPLLRGGRRGDRPSRKWRAGGVVANRQQRRQERAMTKRKRHY
jgi:hypothetical protein